MAVAFVAASQASRDNGGVTLSSDTLTYAAPVAAGSLLVVRARIGSGIAHTITVADNGNAGNWNAAVAAHLAGLGEVVIFYKENTSAGTPTVTISWTDPAATLRWEIAEYTGVATSSSLDQTNVNSGASGAPT